MADQELKATEKQEVQPEQGEFTREGVYFSPAVDIFDTETELVLLADMPGVNADSIDVDLRDDTLTILGKVSQFGAEGKLLLQEYRVGNYFRTFKITDVVDRAKISASVNDGVLKLIFPKAEKAVPRKIPITSS